MYHERLYFLRYNSRRELLKKKVFKCLLACFHFQAEPISDKGDALRIRGFPLVIIDRVAEEGVDGIHLSSVPCNLDGVADFVPSGTGVITTI